MIRFSSDDVDRFRSSSSCDRIIALLKEEVSDFLGHELRIPGSGVSDWSHYYYCPECSVQLVFDPASEHEHLCPVCGRSWSDKHIDGAWWRLRNTFNENAANSLGLLYMLTGDREYAARAGEILLAYAALYPDYEVHGNIPYNGPGKLNAQTLDESNFLRNMAYAYDLIEEALAEDEKECIRERLFRTGMHFLLENRHEQIHNHEVICNGAIGVLALLLGDSEHLEIALEGKYGLHYQLEHGVLEDGFWFECSTAYHFYALQNFLLFERFAMHTEYSGLSNPLYLRMCLAPLSLLKADYSFPLLNDCHISQGAPDAYSLFEFAYRVWGDKRLLAVLNRIYEGRERLSVEAFLYGVPVLPSTEVCPYPDYLEGKAGLGATVMRKGHGYLLFRHGPYGGEHDHYDRLSVSYYYDNVPVSADLGTTGYGARLHYAYYKRTGTHNTISIDEENHAPSSGRLLSFEDNVEYARAKASVLWSEAYTLPDSFTIRQWSEEAYNGVYMEREVVTGNDYVISVMRYRLPSSGRSVDYSMHFHGRLIGSSQCESVDRLSDKEPLCYLEDFRLCHDETVLCEYENQGVFTRAFTWASGADIYLAEGFDNPSSCKMNYILARSRECTGTFVTVMSSARGEAMPVTSASVKNEGGTIRIALSFSDGSCKEYEFR